MMRLWIVSENTCGRRYELSPEETKKGIIDLAMEYGRAEAGEIVQLSDGDNTVSRCYWDTQYREYRVY